MKFLIKCVLAFILGAVCKSAGLNTTDTEVVLILAIYAIGASL